MTVMHEFTDLDPSSFHLVPEGATDFPVLVAKAASDGVAEIQAEDLRKASWAGFCGESKCLCCKEQFGVSFEGLLAAKARLKAKQRNALPSSAFALPDTREYPIHDRIHAEKALQLLHNATPEQQAKIKAAVHRRYPDIQIGGDVKAKKEGPSQGSEQGFAIPGPEGSEGQTRENHPHMGAVHMDVTPEGTHIVVPAFQGSPAPKADQEGHGTTAPGKALPASLALSQTRSLHKAGEGDGRGDPAPDGAADQAAAETEAKTQTHERTEKAPGDAEWEAHDADLAERAGQLISELESREKAEGAEKGVYSSPAVQAALEGLVQAGQQFLAKIPIQSNLTKEIENMQTDELVKLLDERDARRDKEIADAKKAEAKKAKKKMKAKMKSDGDADDMAEKQKAKEAKKVAKAVAGITGLDAAEVLKGIDELTKKVDQIASQPAPLPGPLNGAGIAALGGASNVAAALRGQPAATGLAGAFKQRAPGEEWTPAALRRELLEKGIGAVNA